MAKGRGLTERKKKKRKRGREEKKALIKREQKEKRGRYIKFGAIAAILILAGLYLSKKEIVTSSVPWITIEPVKYDFGDVSVTGGVVKTEMAITNKGDAELVINDMETSCGCTSASITKDGKEGPAFGASGHGLNPVGWSETLKAGESALLNVYYDPGVHSDSRGPATMVIWIYSNDPDTPEKIVKIDTNHVD